MYANRGKSKTKAFSLPDIKNANHLPRLRAFDINKSRDLTADWN